MYFKYGNKGAENTRKTLDPENIGAELTKPINYEAPKPLKDRVNRVWFYASFVIIPIGALVWLVIAYEIFSKTNQIFFPAVVSALLLLPISVMCLICYVIIMFFMMIFYRK